MSFYKDHYQVVIIGGALAGLSAALQPELSAAAGPSPVPSPCRVPS